MKVFRFIFGIIFAVLGMYIFQEFAEIPEKIISIRGYVGWFCRGGGASGICGIFSLGLFKGIDPVGETPLFKYLLFFVVLFLVGAYI